MINPKFDLPLTISLLNEKVLLYLSRNKSPHCPVVTPPDSVRDPYMGQGSHPDIVQRVWDELGAALPRDCRCMIYGTPALCHPDSGVIIAICNGTQYNLRLTADDYKEAVAKGATTRTRWSTGEEMEATTVLGSDWIFGGWFKDEDKWCCHIYEQSGQISK